MTSQNQLAQQEGDTGANEVARMKQRERAVLVAIRTLAFDGKPLNSAAVAEMAQVTDSEIGTEYCRRIAEVNGWALN